jgi:scyllo-inositol 2-dehydrogenase (NADP+)
MITTALVGFGLSGRYLQAPFFLANPNFRLKTIVTNNQNPIAIYPTVEKATSLEAVLADSEIDLVSICSPSLTHFEYAKQCLLAGKHILVEKPFVSTVSEAKEILALAKKQGKHVFVFQNRRFDSDFLTVKKVIENGFLGEILSFEAHYNRFKPILNPKKWKEIISPANGILYDLGAHIIDQSIALFGKPLAVAGETFTQRQGSEIDDAFDIRLDYGKLKVTLKSSLMVREDTPRYVIQGTHGSFVKYGIDVQEDHLKAGIMPDNLEFGFETPQYNAILNTEIKGLHIRGQVTTERGSWHLLFQNIYDVIENGAVPAIKNDDIVEQLQIINAVKKGG